MNDPTMLSMVVGIGVIVVVGGLSLVMSRSTGTLAEDRLAGLTGERKVRRVKKKQDLSSGILARPGGHRPGAPFVLDQVGPQRRESQPALSAGRRHTSRFSSS